jgi:hypothetical protein
MNKSINLYPTPPAEWLWRDHQEDIKREFHPSVTIPSTDEPLWHECTEADRLAYEAEWAAQHPEESRTLDSDQATEVATADTDQAAEEGLGV